jgi:hypothetical protein
MTRGRMFNRVAFLFVVGLLGLSWASGQEHQQGDNKEGQAPVKKDAGPAMKCCESMDKSAEMKSNMKAKMEKMKSMKEKMADKKMKAGGAEAIKSKNEQDREKKVEPDAHGH